MTAERAAEIVVFGAGGRAGRALLAEAAARGCPVVGVVRDPGRHPDLTARAAPGLRIVRGDATDPACVAAVGAGARALVNAVTPFSAPPESFDGFDGGYYVRLVENFARAAEHSAPGPARVVEIGLAATLGAGTRRLYEDADAFPAFLRPFAEARMRGLRAWRDRSGTTDWLVLTPPPSLSADAPRTGRYRLADAEFDPAFAGVPLSYADLATAVLDEIATPTWHRDQAAVYALPPSR